MRSFASGTFDGEMPYRDPHTASPCVWAIIDRYGPDLEVSVVTPSEAAHKQQRKAMEDALIALHRRVQNQSPVANFARILPGYKQSSYRKDGIVGGPLGDGESEPNTRSGIEALSWDDAEKPTSPNWMGLDWTTPEALSEAYGLPDEAGVYRIWDPTATPPLEYIGETANLKARLYKHRRNRNPEHLYSYVSQPTLDERHKRHEAETDLLGAHWLAFGEAPSDQY